MNRLGKLCKTPIVYSKHNTRLLTRQLFLSAKCRTNTSDPKCNVTRATATAKKPEEAGEELVITGISGRFPLSDSIEEFTQNLFNGVDMVSEHTRWPQCPFVPARYGMMKNLDKFDASFFGIVPKLADAMDPQQRRLMEVTFEAIADAGINPSAMKGTRTGVYVATVGGESGHYHLLTSAGKDSMEGYSAVGIPNFMIANRISYTFDLKGPSMIMSTGCSASLIALEAAVAAIKNGTCDAAVVAGTTIHVDPHESADLKYLGALAPDGKCKSFDDSADGFVRSEAIVAMLVQKKKDAVRHYATIKGLKTNADGYKPEGIVFPSGKSQEVLLREVYKENNIDPGQIKYFEAHGTGTPAGDPQELQTISNVLCKAETRKEPLLLGSVKSNMGHGESAAALCSIAKCLISIQKGQIPANLHFKEPNSYVKHVFDGSLKVVTEPTPFTGGLIGISAFGIGGTNSHLVLEAGPPATPEALAASAPPADLPILLPFSGRSEEMVEESLTEACNHASNPEFAALVRNVFKENIPGHTYRGFGIMRPGEEEHMIAVQKCENAGQRPLWFIFPGMGSQWNEMGKDLMKFDAFLESYTKSRQTLKNAGVDLDHLLRAGNPTIFSNIRDSLVSITAVQIALYDTIMSMGLKPDGFIGHSSGEIMCAYADGCLSAEEALLVGDARGRAFTEVSTEPGGMCAIGLSWEEILKRCPPTLYPACHNAANNVSVSGPLETVRKFIAELQKEGIFAKEVNSCNCAPHSPFVYPAGDKLFRYMNEIYSTERPRTSRWISSSIPESEWDTPLAQSSSPAYHVNNMGRPVLFYEALQHVPENAVVVEIAPHGLFQAILKQTLPKDTVLVAPMHSMVEDKVSYFLSGVGKIHNSGTNIDIGKLYPSVSFPVHANVPPLSSLIKWDHSASHLMPVVTPAMVNSGEATVKVSTKERAHNYLHGHKLDSRTVFPATGYLTLAWNNLASTMSKEIDTVPVVFENVAFERATFLADDRPANFAVSMLNGEGRFEIREDGATVVKGTVSSPENVHSKMFKIDPVKIPENPDRLSLKTDDIYKELKLRGYNYSGSFRGIREIDNHGRWAKVAWNHNWTSFLDTVLQTVSLSVMTRNTAVPVRFDSVAIDPQELLSYVQKQKEVLGESAEVTVPVSIHPELNTVHCPGIQMRGLTAMVIPRKRQDETLSVDEYNFTPYFDTGNSSASWKSTVAGLVDLVVENNPNKKLKIIDAFSKYDNLSAHEVYGMVTSKPRYTADYTFLSLPSEIEMMDPKIKELGTPMSKEAVDKLIPDSPADIVFSDQSSILEKVGATVNDSGFVILRAGKEETVSTPASLINVSSKSFDNGSLHLFKKKPSVEPIVSKSLSVDNENFDWLPALQSLMAEAAKAPENARFYLTSQNDPLSGIVGLLKCLRQEPGGDKLRGIFDPEGKLSLDFSAPNAELQKIIERDMVMNIWKNGSYGSYRHVPLAIDVTAPSKETEHAYINTLQNGDLTSLRWIESPLKYYNPKLDKSGQVLCSVNFASMNFRDIMLATGKLPIDSKNTASHQDCVMGFEFSGVDPEGNRVMGMMSSKALASSVLAPPEFIWKIPEQWSLEDAATVPIVYATAYYALLSRARLRPGQSVLIHSGTGGVGQAAINIALDRGCEVFTTVGTPEKRRYIKELFPALKDENIGNSRDCSFEQQIMQLTNGRGVDVVLNSLADDKLQASVRCLAIHGKFLEIGAFDAFQNHNLGMGCFLKNVDFQGIFLTHFFSECMEEKLALQKHFLDGIERGVVRPLPRTVFQKDQIEEAFRYMASGKHMGKVVIKVADEGQAVEKPKVKAIPRSYFSPEKTYVVVGGLGGLGLEVADWLVNRGAQKLVLVSRSGVTSGYQDLCMRKWAEKGVEVQTPKLDLSSYDAAEKFVADLEKDGSIGGIFNSTLVLRDGMIEEQTKETYEAVTAPKVKVTKYLDALTRKHCKDLDYFVVFSSAACGRGNVAQSNYGFANSVMEQIVETRKSDGLHGLAIQWGVIGEVGFVAEKILGSKAVGDENFEGTVAQRISSCLDVLDLTLQQDKAVYSSLVLADNTSKKLNKVGIIATMQNMFGLKGIDKIKPETKLIDLGMDSLIGMELKQMLERDYDLPLTPNELRVMNLGDLMAIDAGTFVKANVGKSGAAAGGDAAAGLHTEVMVKLSSGELDEVSPYFMVHGIEGHCGPLTDLAKKLKVSAYGFQYSPEQKTTEDIAKAYLEELRIVQPEGPYNIVGYSAGSPIACEMALQLQREGETSNLIILDGTFNWSAVADMKTNFAVLVEETRPIMKFSPESEKKFLSSLTDDYNTNKDMFMKILGGHLSANEAAILGEIFEASSGLAQSSLLYKPTDTFKGKVYLVRAKEQTGYMKNINDETYYMQEFTANPIEVHAVDGDHKSFLASEHNDQTANILNTIIDKMVESDDEAVSTN